MTDFRRLVTAVKRVKAVVDWFMKTGLLSQFSLAAEWIGRFAAYCGFL